MDKIIQYPCCKERAVQLFESITDPFVYLEKADQYKWWFVFGKEGGNVEYRYKFCGGKLDEWIKWIEEQNFKMDDKSDSKITFVKGNYTIEIDNKKELSSIAKRLIKQFEKQFNVNLMILKSKHFPLKESKTEVVQYYLSVPSQIDDYQLLLEMKGREVKPIMMFLDRLKPIRYKFDFTLNQWEEYRGN